MHALAESLRARAAARLSPAATAAGDYFARLYERRKAARGEIDYDDIEYLAWRAVVFDSLALEIVGKMDRRCRHLVVDEFQDANPAQWAIVRRWLHDCHGSERAPSVFVVGDKKQAIYGFRGGDSRLLDCAADFLRDYYRAAQIAENTSRRCAPLLLRVVDRVFLRARKRARLIPRAAILRLILKTAIPRLIPKIPKTTISRRIARIRKIALCPRGLFVIRY